MVGSMLLFEAESIEAVKKRIESDIYYTSGVVSSSHDEGSSVTSDEER